MSRAFRSALKRQLKDKDTRLWPEYHALDIGELGSAQAALFRLALVATPSVVATPNCEYRDLVATYRTLSDRVARFQPGEAVPHELRYLEKAPVRAALRSLLPGRRQRGRPRVDGRWAAFVLLAIDENVLAIDERDGMPTSFSMYSWVKEHWDILHLEPPGSRPTLVQVRRFRDDVARLRERVKPLVRSAFVTGERELERMEQLENHVSSFARSHGVDPSSLGQNDDGIVSLANACDKNPGDTSSAGMVPLLRELSALLRLYRHRDAREAAALILHSDLAGVGKSDIFVRAAACALACNSYASPHRRGARTLSALALVGLVPDRDDRGKLVLRYSVDSPAELH